MEEEAGRRVAGGGFLEGRLAFGAGIELAGAAWMKAAAAGWVDGVGHVAFQDDALLVRTGGCCEYGGHQGLSVRVARVCIEVLVGGQFHGFAQTHHGDTAAEVFHGGA